MSIIVDSPGLCDTLQDAGRPGYRAFGVPLGGWFDAGTAAFANALVGNGEEAPCLEVTLRSGTFRVLNRIRVGIAGPGAVITFESARSGARLFQESVAIDLDPGESFRVHHPRRGLRSYIAAAGGGWSGSAVLGSCSAENRLVAGQRIEACAMRHDRKRRSPTKSLAFVFDRDSTDQEALCFVPTGRSGGLSLAFEPFCRIGWRMSSRSDRVGVRFEPVEVEELAGSKTPDISQLSEPVVPGTIQWTGSELIVLGVAGGTMGGYPVIGHLLCCEFARLAQLRPGMAVRFRPKALEAAWSICEQRDRDRNRALRFVRIAEGHDVTEGGDFVTD